MAIESLKPNDRPTALIENVLRNKGNLLQLIIDSENKDILLGVLKKHIDSFNPQERLSIFRSVFDILPDGHAWNQVQREGALELLRLIDLKGIEPKVIEESYLGAVDGLDQNADLYGEIDALLTAGKIMAPFIPGTRSNQMRISLAWNKVALRFTGADGQKILDDTREIKNLMPAKQASELDVNVAAFFNGGLTDNTVVVTGRERNQQLLERVKELRRQGKTNSAIASELNIKSQDVHRIVAILIRNGELSRRKAGRKKPLLS